MERRSREQHGTVDAATEQGERRSTTPGSRPLRRPSGHRLRASSRRRRSASALFPLALASVLLVVACGGDDEPPPGELPTLGPDAAEPAADSLLAGPLDAVSLRPVFTPLGTGGAVERLTVSFARPVVTQGSVGPVSGDGTRMTWEPEVPGELVWTDPATLVFQPSAPLSASTTYRVRLTSVDSTAGPLAAPGPRAWSTTLETPPRDFAGASLVSWDAERSSAVVELLFSIAVDPRQAVSGLRLDVVDAEGRERGAPRRRLLTEEPSTRVRLRLDGPEVAPGRTVRAELDPGRNGGVAGSGLIRLPGRAGMEIKAAYLQEGPSGFHVEVVCDDSSVEGRRWYWDSHEQDSWQLSSRCLLSEEGADAIVVDPPVDVAVTASEGGFRIRGDFARGAYRLRLPAGVASVDGGTLRQALEVDLRVPARSPQLAFVGQGRYLPRDGWDAVPVRHLNLNGARLEVRHVPPENLAFWLGQGSERADERTSAVVARTTLRLAGELDQPATTTVDLAALVPAGLRGLFEVRVEGADVEASTRMMVTDLTLVAKRTGLRSAEERGDRDWGSGVAVWALDSDSLAGLRGAEVSLQRRNGQVLGACRTDGGGGCRIDLEPGIDPSPPFVLVAEHRGDLTYVAFDELRSEIQETRVAGRDYRAAPDATAYAAALWTERGVYRPGETAHVAAILRQREGGAVSADLPVSLKIVDPRGKTLRERVLRTNGAGFVTDDVGFADFATTGRYRAVVEVADREVARETFQVEEFVPERLAVGVRPVRADVLARESAAADIDARFLFGGTPSGAGVQLDCELQPTRFVPPRNAEFTYGPWQGDEDAARPLQLGTAEARLDDAGTARLACPRAETSGSLLGPAMAVLRAAVTEAGSGRATVARATVRVHPDRRYVGLDSGSAEAGVGDTVRVRGVVVDWEGTTVDVGEPVRLEFVRLEREWGSFYDPEQGHNVYRMMRRPLVVEEREVVADAGRFEVDFVVDAAAAGYLVRARLGDARTELHLESSTPYYWWGPRESQRDITPRPGRARWIALEVPERVRVDEDLVVRFDAPFTGRALLTLESDELLASEWIDVDAGANVWTARVRDRDLRRFHDGGVVPNVYASAFVIKDPHLESEATFLPDRALGVASVDLVLEHLVLDPVLETPPEVRSSSPLRIALDLGAAPSADEPRWAVVAAVDEGVLSLTDYESPEPLPELMPRRALGIETFETVGWTMAQVDDPASTVGGDQAPGGSGRVAPVRPVALWSGLRPVPADGRLEVEFAVPSFRGALRVMAVAAGSTRTGSAEATVLVRDPLVLQTTLPRFLVRGDVAEVPAFVTNLSGARRSVRVAVEVEDLGGGGDAGVEIVGAAEQSLDLDVERGAAATFRLRGVASSGAVRLRLTATAGDLVSSETLDVPLVPAGPDVRRTERLRVGGDQTTTVALEGRLGGWEPNSETTTFWLARNRFADVFEHLGHLVDYPYGCLEQTTSTTRPLLTLRPFESLLRSAVAEGEEGRPADLDAMTQRGIDRILSMQTPDGGFAYWPGGSEPAYWASAYATDLLLDARRERFEVPEERLDQVLDWMEREIQRDDLRLRDGYSDDGRPYMHWVLARAERGQQGAILRALATLEREEAEAEQRRAVGGPVPSLPPAGQFRENRYLLQAALYLTGDHRFEDALRDPASGDGVERSYGWSFYSDRRRRGLMLAVAVELFGNEGGGAGTSPLEPLAQVVAEGLRASSSRYTTQELVWGLTGLGRYSAAPVASRLAAVPELRVDGRVVTLDDPSADAAASSWSWTVPRAADSSSVQLEVPAVDRPLSLQVTSIGVRSGADQPGPGSAGVTVQRRFRRADGSLFDPASTTLELGEVVTAELRLRNLTGERVTNLALSDRLAAGLEIENPRLGRGGDGSAAPWLEPDDLWDVDHLELRDDRLQAFGTLEAGAEAVLAIQLRATTAGRFTAPMPTLEAMYNPEVWARAPATAVTVTGAEASPAAAGAEPGG